MMIFILLIRVLNGIHRKSEWRYSRKMLDFWSAIQEVEIGIDEEVQVENIIDSLLIRDYRTKDVYRSQSLSEVLSNKDIVKIEGRKILKAKKLRHKLVDIRGEYTAFIRTRNRSSSKAKQNARFSIVFRPTQCEADNAIDEIPIPIEDKNNNLWKDGVSAFRLPSKRFYPFVIHEVLIFHDGDAESKWICDWIDIYHRPTNTFSKYFNNIQRVVRFPSGRCVSVLKLDKTWFALSNSRRKFQAKINEKEVQPGSALNSLETPPITISPQEYYQMLAHPSINEADDLSSGKMEDEFSEMDNLLCFHNDFKE
ncbi:hypothetical protein ACOME3_004407 [Neoechinorhynchus agilis]